MQLTSSVDWDPPPDRATAAPIDTQNRRCKPRDTGATPSSARASTSPIWPRRRRRHWGLLVAVLYLRRRGAVAGALFFAVVATSRARVCSTAMCCRAGKLEAMRFWRHEAAREYLSPPANSIRWYAPRMPQRSRARKYSAWHHFLQAKASAGSLNTSPEGYARPARRWKSVCHIFCSCELVQRHTRTPRLFARSPATGLLPARHLLAARTCEKPDIAALRAAGRGAGRIEPSAEG